MMEKNLYSWELSVLCNPQQEQLGLLLQTQLQQLVQLTRERIAYFSTQTRVMCIVVQLGTSHNLLATKPSTESKSGLKLIISWADFEISSFKNQIKHCVYSDRNCSITKSELVAEIQTIKCEIVQIQREFCRNSYTYFPNL